MRAAGLAGQCWGRVPSRPTSTSSRGLDQKCKLQLRDAAKLQVGPNALSAQEAPQIAELWVQTVQQLQLRGQNIWARLRGSDWGPECPIVLNQWGQR